MIKCIECTGCKKYNCLLGSPEQKEHLYYDKPYWFCYNCIGCATIDGDKITVDTLPTYEQPTEESYKQDLRDSYTQVMANNDKKFHPDESPAKWNKRIRELVKSCYHKILLQPEHYEKFNEWNNKITAPDFPIYASRFALFDAAPELCLDTIGL
jgi:hypothetical protein